MDKPFYKQFHARRAAIKSEIDELKNEDRLLDLAGPLFYQDYLVFAEDKITKRTAHKFAVLGQIVKYLTKNSFYRQSGASAKDLYQRVIQKDFPKVSLSTFRGQLTRFKDEGRMTYDEEKGTWNLIKREEIAP